jgi:microcin C transport system substrate-binding protein
MITDYYRDLTVTFEAFKAGAYDLRLESNACGWTTGYGFPAAKHGQVVKDAIKTDQGFLYAGFFYNTRRPLFQDPVLREALAYAFDYSWMNKNLFCNFFVRTRSYFGNGELAAHGLPSPQELKLLEPYRNQLPPRVFTQEYNPPDTDGTEQGLRNNLRIAMQMLTKAGYKMENGRLISPITKAPVEFELLMGDPAVQLVSGHWADNLKLIGVTARVRTLDLPQFIKLSQDYNYDVIVTFGAGTASDTPGREQRSYWSSEAANTKGRLNYSGVKNQVVDALLDKLANAQSQDDLLTAVHALDRVLTWNFYSVPHYSSDSIKIAYWDKFGKPKTPQSFGLGYNDTWWIDPKKDAALHAAGGGSN